MRSDDGTLARERLLWRGHAGVRFTLGSDRERAMHSLLKTRVQAHFHRLQNQAAHSRVGMDFCWARLTILVISAMNWACEYCGELFGVEDFGVVENVPHSGRDAPSTVVRLANLRVSCARCAAAKGPLSGAEFLDLVAALRAADRNASAMALEALGLGYREMALRARRQGTSPTTPAAGNARGGVSH